MVLSEGRKPQENSGVGEPHGRVKPGHFRAGIPQKPEHLCQLQRDCYRRCYPSLDATLNLPHQNRARIELARLTNFGRATTTCWPYTAPGSSMAT